MERKEYIKQWKLLNPEKVREHGQRSRKKNGLSPKRKFSKRTHRSGIKMTFDEYNQMLLSQDGVCRICKKEEVGKSLAMDHSHETGEVRGLLCMKCNRGIGCFDDNPQLLLLASQYLL